MKPDLPPLDLEGLRKHHEEQLAFTRGLYGRQAPYEDANHGRTPLDACSWFIRSVGKLVFIAAIVVTLLSAALCDPSAQIP